ncbi:hypothetical protein BKA70DRAFT_1287544 [Coprinopsis sp. MPI-PUGE-AT-0042]|nr:hypothetical protein BKA70DRAFT_1287544 [Coprinopsis sp. MPI-PUGE-AT-0042]
MRPSDDFQPLFGILVLFCYTTNASVLITLSKVAEGGGGRTLPPDLRLGSETDYVALCTRFSGHRLRARSRG